MSHGGLWDDQICDLMYTNYKLELRLYKDR